MKRKSQIAVLFGFTFTARLVSANQDVALQQAIHDALYRIEERHADNMAQRLSVEFQATPPNFRLRTGSFALELTGYGDPVKFSVSGNRAEYFRPGIREWYINDTSGIEQGFNVEQPQKAGMLTLTLKV